MDSAECAKHFSPEEIHTLPDLWYNSARAVSRSSLIGDACSLQALWGADFMANHTLEGIQCIVLMMVFMVSLKKSRTNVRTIGIGRMQLGRYLELVSR